MFEKGRLRHVTKTQKCKRKNSNLFPKLHMPFRIFRKIKRQITYRVPSGHLLFLEIESNDDFCSEYKGISLYYGGKIISVSVEGRCNIKISIFLLFSGYQDSTYYVPVTILNVL